MVQAEPYMAVGDTNQRAVAQDAEEGANVNWRDMMCDQKDQQDHGHRN